MNGRRNIFTIAAIIGCGQLPCRSAIISISGDSRVVFIEYLRGQSIDLMIGPVAFPFNDLTDFRPRFLGTFPGVNLAQPPRTVARNGGSDARSDRVGLGSSPGAHQTMIPAPQLCLDSRGDVRWVDRQTTLHA